MVSGVAWSAAPDSSDEQAASRVAAPSAMIRIMQRLTPAWPLRSHVGDSGTDRVQLGRAIGTQETWTWRMGMKKLAIAALAIVAIGLAGCNTVKGLGRDIESVGQAGDEAL